MYVCMRVCVCVCVRACVRVSMYAFVRACACVRVYVEVTVRRPWLKTNTYYGGGDYIYIYKLGAVFRT